MQNKIIIDLVNKYTKEKKRLKVILDQINSMRIYKKLYLLFELVGINQRQLINTYYNNKKSSLIQQKFFIKDYNIYTLLEYEIQREFKVWLRNRDIITTINFKKK